jgi:hypothetical protein
LLHSLPIATLEHLVNDGLAIQINDLYPERTITLELGTVTDLRRALKREPIKSNRRSSSSLSAPFFK